MITYLTLVIINLFTLIFLTFNRSPHQAYKYQCYSINSHSYAQCTFRSWCLCEEKEQCAIICYESEEKCVQYFTKKTMKYSKQIKTNGQTVLIRYDTGDSVINLYNRVDKENCYLKSCIIVIILSFFVGGVAGCLIFGILADKFGKKIIIICETIIVEIDLFFIAIYSNSLLSDYDSLNTFTYIWALNGFISGSCLLSLEYFIYIQFLESYPDVNYFQTINGFLHSNYAFSGMSLIIFTNIIGNYAYFFYFATFYFLFFLLFVIFFQVENPRYYSERKDYHSKKSSFESYITKILILKNKEDGSEDKFWRRVLFFDSTKQIVVNDEIIEKVIEPSDKELNLLYQSRLKERSQPNDNKTKMEPKKTGKKKTKILPNINNELIVNQQKKSTIFNNRITLPNNFNAIKSVQSSVAHSMVLLNKNQNIDILKSVLNNEKNLTEISILCIYRKCIDDEYLQKYFFVFLLVWMSISFCFYGLIFDLLFSVVDPNKDDFYRDAGFLFYSIFMTFIMPIVAGKISWYFNSDKIIFFALLISSFIALIVDSPYIFPDLERSYYFGTNFNFLQGTAEPYSKATALFFVIIVYSFFELKTANSIPTLYRTFFHSIVKSSAKITVMFAYVNVSIMDIANMNLGIIGIFTCFIILWVDIKWNECRLLEYTDSDKAKKKEFFINLEKKEAKLASNSIFTRLRNFSIKKFKKT